MNEIAEASKRISALLAGAKQYSQMDRAPYQSGQRPRIAAQHDEDLFGDKVGHDKPVNLVKDWDKSLPESHATQAISMRCGPTSSTMRSRRWTAAAR